MKNINRIERKNKKNYFTTNIDWVISTLSVFDSNYKLFPWNINFELDHNRASNIIT